MVLKLYFDNGFFYIIMVGRENADKTKEKSLILILTIVHKFSTINFALID